MSTKQQSKPTQRPTSDTQNVSQVAATQSQSADTVNTSDMPAAPKVDSAQTAQPATASPIDQVSAAVTQFAQQQSANMSETREEWMMELNRDFDEAKADKAKAAQEVHEVAEDIIHPSRLVEAAGRGVERVGEKVQAVGHDMANPHEALEKAHKSVEQEIDKVADELKQIGEDLKDPIDEKKLPVAMRIYGWLCIVSGLVVVGATIKGIVDAVEMFHDGGMANYGASTVVVVFVHLVVIGLLAITYIVFGTRLLKNQRKFAAYLAYALYILIAVGLACSVMLSGVTWTLGVYVALFAIAVAVQSYLDPSLRDERKLHRLLKEREDLKAAEAGTLGRDPEGKGYITLNFFNLFWIFVVCSVLGMYMEDIVHVLIVDPGHWQDRAGLLFGPFSPIYGFGAVLMTIFLNRFHKKNLILIFLLSAVIGGAFEYFVSWFMQIAYGAVAWDYTGQWLSIGGRTCGWAMACWGLLGCVWIKFLLPLLLHVINLIPWNWRYGVTTVCAALMLVDGVMSLMALDCWYERLSGNPETTPIQKFYGEYFDNDFMENRFQSMTIHPDDAIRHGKSTASEATSAATSSVAASASASDTASAAKS